MIIDGHGHYTTVPRKLHAWRDRQLAAVNAGSERPQPAELDMVMIDAAVDHRGAVETPEAARHSNESISN
jgi:4-oxalmesaconate hydratase